VRGDRTVSGIAFHPDMANATREVDGASGRMGTPAGCPDNTLNPPLARTLRSWNPMLFCLDPSNCFHPSWISDPRPGWHSPYESGKKTVPGLLEIPAIRCVLLDERFLHSD
jgi:hypothetical protein